MIFAKIKNYFLILYTQFIKRLKHIKLGSGVTIYPNSYLSTNYKQGGTINDGSRIGCFDKGYLVGFPNRTRIITLGSGNIYRELL